uniref:Isoform 2 of Serum response factor-binding protein 1 n=1 Tax=Xenopus tropicalis TaxID=8364 RepID=Q5XGC9-2|nr:serum response factor binding protein 1 [Xenopus tropicalis]
MEPVLNLNNEVVKLRKDVKKVKVLIIRKLTRHIAKLKSKKGTEELILKNQRRAQRLLEEIHSVKELKPDDVTKTALRKEISFEKVCKKPNSTAEERALARLATHPLLKQKITAIKEAIKAFKDARKTAAEGEREREKDEPEQVTKIKETKKPVQAKLNKNTEEIKSAKEHVKEEKCKNLLEDSDKGTEKALELPYVQENLPEQTAENKEQPKAQDVERPAVERPAVERPAVERPAVERPAVERPAVERPAVERPAVERPAVERPAVERPAVERPAVERPAVERPAVERPAVERPAVERPAVERPAVERPAVERPAVERPVVESPAVERPPVESPPKKKACLEQELGCELSDIEDSDKEKEYFDDSTEERFYKHSSSFEDSDSGSDNDFFIGKIRRTKKKKSDKDGSKQKEEKVPPTKEKAQTSEVQKEIPTAKSMKLKSVFCKSLSQTKPKPSFTKRETNFRQERNKRPVMPQASPLAKKPLQSKATSVRQPGRKLEAQPLHPSWEASRKRKEQQAQITKFQGKKIVFDD